MKKTKILAITEASYLDSGYAQYWHYILRELSKRENYEVAEFATFVDPLNNKLSEIPWTVFPNIPQGMSIEEFREWSKNPMNNFGAYLFNTVALDFEPDVVLHCGDWWMQKYINESPYRKCFKYIWLAPCDAAPQNIEWIEDMFRCDGVLTYNDWSKGQIEKQSSVKVYASAPPAAQDHFYPMNKKAIKEHFNIRPEIKFIGTVMRNQRRKLFPNLFESYKKFIDDTGNKDVYLYCHTSYPDGSWRIPELIQEYGVADRVFFTYRCRGCHYVFPSLYSDIATCGKCGIIGAMMPNTMFGVSSEQLGLIYNLFDVYVQYANSEGFGLPMVEAASCAVPIMAVDYSSMTDVVRKLSGEPIKVKALVKEIETGCFRAVPDDDHFVELLKNFFKKPEMIRNTYGLRARNMFLKNYKWEDSAKRWSELIDKVGYGNWQVAPEIHTPAELNGEDSKLNNAHYARWLMVNVAGRPDKVGSFMETQLVRDLNYGMSTGIFTPLTNQNEGSLFNDNKTEPFSRTQAYEQFKQIGEQKRILEIIRARKLGYNV